MNIKKKIVILGGGLTGLSSAFHLEKIRGKANFDYIVIEKEKTLGGLCRSFESKGFTFDIGGHFLHTKNAYIKKLVRKLLSDNRREVERKSEILTTGRKMPYPFQGNLFYLPDKIKFECLEEYVKAYARRENGKNKDMNFREWIEFNFGKGIARHFMIPFNSKLYGYPLDKIHAENMKKYIPVPDLGEVLDGALFKSGKLFGYNTTFTYPQKGGIQTLVNAFESEIRNTIKGEEVYKINMKKKMVSLKSGEIIHYDSIISSIPLKELSSIIEDAPEKIRREGEKLKCASLVIVNVGYRAKRKMKTQWFYLPGGEYSCYRAGYYSAVAPSMAPARMNSAYIEFSLGEREGKINVSAYKKKAVKSLKLMGAISRESDILVCDAIPVRYGYVIFDKNRDSSVNKLSDFLEKKNIYAGGRYGRWEYSAMTDAIASGKGIAERILKRGLL